MADSGALGKLECCRKMLQRIYVANDNTAKTSQSDFQKKKKTKNEAIFLNSDFSLVTNTEMEPNVYNFKRKQK